MPCEGSRVFVPVVGPLLDCVGEFFDGGVGASAYLFGGDLREPAFHEVQPGAVGRSEVESESRVFELPAFDLRCVVSGEVVQHDVHIQPGGHLGVDLIQERFEFFSPVTFCHSGYDLAGGHIESRVQIRCATTAVVMGSALGCRGQERQDRRCSVQGLYLGFLALRTAPPLTQAGSGTTRRCL